MSGEVLQLTHKDRGERKRHIEENMTDQNLIQLAQRFGTPSYVFDTKALQERMQQIQEIFGDKIRLCYSIKANPFLIPAMLEKAACLEVCSPGELSICERLKVPMDRIVYSGVNKEPEDVKQAVVVDRVGVCTAESLRHVELLEKAAAERAESVPGREDADELFSEEEQNGAGKDRIPVLLRLNSGAQFGMSERDLLSVIEKRAEYPHLEIVGVHYFVGTQRKNKGLHQQKEELQMLKTFFDKVEKEYHFRLQRLEYGPGLPVPLFYGDDYSDTLAPARELAPFLQEVTQWADLTVEAGRFYTTTCGYYLTKVMDRKLLDDGKQYCIVDGGIHHVNYLGQIMGMKEPVIRHFRGNGSADADPAAVRYRRISDKEEETGENYDNWVLCGSLCTTNDDLVRSRFMAEPEMGDLLVFENIGAYSVTEGIYLFLSRKMPRIVLYNDISDVRLVRDFVDSSLLNTPQSEE